MQFQGGNNVLQRSRSEPDFEIDQMPMEQGYNENRIPMAEQDQVSPDDTQYGRAQKKLVEQDRRLKKMQQERKIQDQMQGQNDQGQGQNVNFRDPIPRTKMMSNYGPQPAQGFNQSINNQEDYERENQRWGNQFVQMKDTTRQEYPEDMYEQQQQQEQQQMMQMQEGEQMNEDWEQDQPYFIKERVNSKISYNKFACFFIIGIFMSILLFYKISKDKYNFIPKRYSVASYIVAVLSLSFIVTTILTR